MGIIIHHGCTREAYRPHTTPERGIARWPPMGSKELELVAIPPVYAGEHHGINPTLLEKGTIRPMEIAVGEDTNESLRDGCEQPLPSRVRGARVPQREPIRIRKRHRMHFGVIVVIPRNVEPLEEVI